MAEITRTNGNAFGVVNHDRGLAGSGAITADETVIMEGPQLDFFKVVAGADLSNELDTGESVELILQDVQKRAVIAMYQVEGDATGVISLAVYPAGAWTAASLQTSLQALGATAGANNVDLTGATVTDPGFELV